MRVTCHSTLSQNPKAFHKLHGGGQQRRADDDTDNCAFQSIFVTLTEEYFEKTGMFIVLVDLENRQRT